MQMEEINGILKGNFVERCTISALSFNQLGFTVAISRATFRLPPKHRIRVANPNSGTYFATNHRISLLAHSLQPDLNLPIIIRKRPLSHAKRASIFAYYYIKAYCYLRTKFCICIYLSLFCSSVERCTISALSFNQVPIRYLLCLLF